MRTIDMEILTVGGSPRDRGRAIGESLRDDIHAVIHKHEQAIDSRPGYSIKDYYAGFDACANHLPTIKRWAPDLLEEVRGIAEGANIAMGKVFRFNLVDEDWCFDNYHYRPKAKVHNKCTTFGVVNDDGGPTYAGQNMDVMSYVEGHQVLLRIQYPDSDLEALVYTFAGTIALCGINNAPLGVNCNTLMQLGYNQDGLPVTFITRRMLEMRSADEALVFLKEVPHASGHNYTISAPGRVGSFECSPKKIVEYRPHEDGLRVCHTNHPLANGDTESFRELLKLDPTNPWGRGGADTCSRLSSIAARTVYREGPIGIDDLKAALRAKDDPQNPVCRDLSTNTHDSVIAYTAGSMIYELDDNPRLHLAAGPPSESEFLTYEFSKA